MGVAGVGDSNWGERPREGRIEPGGRGIYGSPDGSQPASWVERCSLAGQEANMDRRVLRSVVFYSVDIDLRNIDAC